MLQDIVRVKMVESLKAGDKARKGVLSLLVSALANKEKENKMPLSKEQEDEVVVKMAKQIKETLASCSSRPDMVEKCNFELSIVNEFMPKQMSEVELHEVIKSVLTELNIDEVTVKHKGLIMKNLMPLVKGKIDGQIVNKTLESYFSK